MKAKKTLAIALLLLILMAAFTACNGAYEAPAEEPANEIIDELTRLENSPIVYILPPYSTDGEMSVEMALATRRSRRNFQDRAITTEQLSQILWAAYGITYPLPQARLRGGLRTTPSAGATFPLEIYVAVGNVEGIEPGVYRYIPESHTLVQVLSGDVRDDVGEAAVGQTWAAAAPILLFYSAVFSRTTDFYGERGVRYVYMEVGHSAQNVHLQAEALGLGTVVIAAFFDDRMAEIFNLPEDEVPLYFMPVGYFYE
ncbi:MAG: SagB/ThcOx family dehydrogenase [Firmicutes bacterium]|nr:SagB/ThcOx family dehydrogenase [Bacillota bacterium]